MSRPTPYRPPEDQCATFAQFHDKLRRRMAMVCLCTRRVSVGEPAHLLGFSEATTFVGAFRRRTGVSPAEWLGN
ncbi:helix-turn-helix domain-containing protein [Halovulum sp. GXIMD14794]